MKTKELMKKVSLLKEGQIVEIDGLYFSAKRIDKSESLIPCHYCNVDCLCKGNIVEVCAELDFFSKYDWCLNLES